MDKAEIARKLRYHANDGSKAPMNDLKSVLGMESGASYRDVFRALADLIEGETCRVESCTSDVMWLSCGHHVSIIDGTPSFCPHCGAKVVSGE